MVRRQGRLQRGERNQELLGTVRSLGRSGDGVVETDRGIVFVPSALPGERVRLKLAAKSRGALRGQLLEVLSPSVERVEPECPVQAACGGCPLMPLSVTAQHKHRLAMVRDAVAGVAASGVEVSLVQSPLETGYRTRTRMMVRGGSGQGPGRVGYRREGKHEMCEIPGCPVLDGVVASGLSALRKGVLPALAGRGELHITRGAFDLPVVWLSCEKLQPPEAYAACEALVQGGGLAGIALLAEELATPARFGDTRQCLPGADGKPLWGPELGFSQSNQAVNDLLANTVLELAEPKGKRVLELYCGHGNLSVLLAAPAAEFDGVEAAKDAVPACRENLTARGIERARVHAMAAEDYPYKRPADVVVLDPPRTGAKEVVPKVLGLRPKTVVYVSCDPPTLARDLKMFQEGGYEVDFAQAFDMFPQTAHVEAVVRLRPR